MINYYQTSFFGFLGKKIHQPPENIKTHYYLSFEDALWDVLTKKKIPFSSTILVPDFYCLDVLENIKNHGYQVFLYKLDENFQITTREFLKAIKKAKPTVVIIFHACGITSKVLQKNLWPELNNILLIEDCVQKLVNPEKVKLFAKNHILIDSLRKVSPFPGSFVYAQKEFFDFKPTEKNFSLYSVASLGLFFLFRIVYLFANFLDSGKLVEFAHKRILKWHDDLIGDSKNGYAGFAFFKKSSRKIDFERIEKIKKYQTQIYSENLEKVFKINNRNLFPVIIPESDFAKLHVFPILNKSNNSDLIQLLQSQNMAIWEKFPDAPWSQDKKVIFLPLGPHIKDKDIKKITGTISEYLLERS